MSYTYDDLCNAIEKLLNLFMSPDYIACGVKSSVSMIDLAVVQLIETYRRSVYGEPSIVKDCR
jgi:hypothetical protein